MIPGVVASSVFAPAGFTPPADAFVYFDFTAGEYWLNGTETALSSLFNRSDFVVAGSGALFDWSTADTPAEMSSTLLSAINASGGSFTVVCEWMRLGGGYSDTALFIVTDVSGHNIEFGQALAPLASPRVEVTAKLSEAMWPYLLTFTPPPGVGNVARSVLRYDQANGTALAVNGTFATSSSGTASPVKTFVSGALAGYPGDPYLWTYSYIRKIEFYPVKSDAEITALSAL